MTDATDTNTSRARIPRTKLEIGAGLVVVAILCVFLYQWHRSEIDIAAAQAKAEVLQRTVDEAQKSINGASDAIAKRDAVLAQQQQTFAQQLASIRTPQQAQPIILDYAAKNLPSASVTAQVDAKTGATQYSLTPEGVVALGKQIATCQENASELAACTKDKADFQHITTDLTTQRDSYKQEAEEWKKAAKGGSKWQRTMRVVKYAVIFGGVGYALGRR